VGRVRMSGVDYQGTKFSACQGMMQGIWIIIASSYL
jgi:hypothetical protein